MKLPTEDNAVPDIARRFKKHFGFADIVFEKSKELISGTVNSPGELCLCLLPVLTRMMRLHYCSIKLASLGCALEGKLQARSMFENLVNVLALEHSENVALYARRWIAWDLANNLKQIRVFVRDNPNYNYLLKEREKLLKTTKEAINADSREMGLKKWHGNNERINKYVKERWGVFERKGPSMEDIRTLAGIVDAKIPRCNLQRTYDQFYPYASGVMHGSDVKSLVEAKKIAENKIVLKLAPSPVDILELVLTSSFFLGRTAASVSRVMKIGGDRYPDEMDRVLNLYSHV